MKTATPFRFLFFRAAVILAIAAFAGCSKKAADKATEPASSDEIQSLREEVAALRDEVARLRHHIEHHGSTEVETEDGYVTPADSSAELMDQITQMRADLAKSQSELSSNLVEITIGRGSDAWRRGDFKEAMKLLKPLAESGQPIAEHRIGVMYVLGQGVEKDPVEAIKWFTKAAEQGQGESQHSLGLRYLWGDGTDKDPQAAATWFTAAANQGIPDAATWLGDMYWNGNGVQADPVEAYKWLILSGDKFNINHHGVTLDQFAAMLTPEQRAEAERRAQEFAPTRVGPEDF